MVGGNSGLLRKGAALLQKMGRAHCFKEDEAFLGKRRTEQNWGVGKRREGKWGVGGKHYSQGGARLLREIAGTQGLVCSAKRFQKERGVVIAKKKETGGGRGLGSERKGFPEVPKGLSLTFCKKRGISVQGSEGGRGGLKSNEEKKKKKKKNKNNQSGFDVMGEGEEKKKTIWDFSERGRRSGRPEGKTVSFREKGGGGMFTSV